MPDSALQFNGGNGNTSSLNFGTVPAFQLAAGAPFCIEAWVFVLQNASGTRAIFNCGLNFAGNKGMEFRVTPSGNIPVLSLVYGNQTFTGGSPGVQMNKWTFVVADYNGTDLILFSDGNDRGHTAISTPIGDATNSSSFIGAEGSAANVFAGMIDELRFSNASRYHAFISSRFTVPKDPLTVDGSTVELFHFNEGQGSTTTGANGIAGTLTGSTKPAWVPGAFTTPWKRGLRPAIFTPG